MAVHDRRLRFAAQAALLARVYAGYKLVQGIGRLGVRGGGRRLHRQHRRSAEAAYRLATRLEGLPIKMCQFLGSRADVLPGEYIEVLSRLQDRVPPRRLATLLPVLREGLGCPVEEVFARVDARPVAAASLAQVHRGRLRDGREVAIKIQYPEIARLVDGDLRNFAFLIDVLRRLERNLDLRVLIDEVRKLVPLELDFVNEADNAERMAACLRARADVWVPGVIRSCSSRRVLVTEYAEGVRVTDVEGLRAYGVDPKEIARRLSDVFTEMILRHGFFHGDPHPGNILVQPSGRLVLLDFGLAKAFPPGFREGVARLTLAIMGGVPAQVAAAFRALGFRTREESDESLALLGEAFLGFAVRQQKAYADPDVLAQFNRELPEAMRRNPLIEVPGDILLVGRVMGLLSGIGKQLGSEVDVRAALLPYVAGVVPEA
ncbi:MAG TPA: AarF/UbiB family protein [Candidatus Binatia bacterium]|nr:AarF/UbiB family protein [Candidatus Binatia bacterium]